LEDIVSEAHRLGIRPWLALKERLSLCAIEVVAAGGGDAVLQGGAALHFAYGSPRLSADVDFVGPGVAAVLERSGEPLARAAGELLGCAACWSMTRAGRLLRGKLALAVDPARRLVLPIEAFEVPAHTSRPAATLGVVEEPVEIAADKIVASADRFARRGTLKTTDIFDLWYLRARLGIQAPDRGLVEAKAADYGLPAHGADLGGVVRAVPAEELRAVLEGVLPTSELDLLHPAGILETAADLLARYRDVV
jgi:hypothetical protein